MTDDGGPRSAEPGPTEPESLTDPSAPVQEIAVDPQSPVAPAPVMDNPMFAAPVLDPPIATPVDPLVDLPQRGGRLLAASFDVLTTGRSDLRRGSLYIGLVLLLTAGPIALLVLALTIKGVDTVDFLSAQSSLIGQTTLPASVAGLVATTVGLTAFLALAGYIVVLIDGQTLAILLLAGRLAGRRVPLRAAIGRSRVVFWRIAGGSIIVGIPLYLVQLAVQYPLTGGLSHPSQGATLFATAIGTLVGWPFVYLVSGIVLGDVRAMEAVRRSVKLARARPLTALAISIFAALAQYLTVFGIGAAGDLVERVVNSLGLDVNGGPFTVVAVGDLVLVLVLAFGTLQFTVTAITIAPQVVAFLALTRYTGGIDRALETVDVQPLPFGYPPPVRGPGPRFRWIQWRVLAVVAVLASLTFVTLARLAGT